MKLLVFNQHSICETSTVEEVNSFFLDLAKGIKTYISENGISNSRFFTELENFKTFEIVPSYCIIDAIKSLSRDLKSIILDLITMRCNDDCLNKLSEDEIESVTDYEIIFKGEASGKDYMILSFTLEKKGILLSFNRDRWNTNSINALKFQNNETTEINIDNIATEEHAQELIDKDILAQLPMDNIIYSNEFKDWLLGKEESPSPDKDKINTKINECVQNEFKIDLDFIKALDKEVFEIRVGSLGGLQHSQIRVLLKFDGNKKYVLLGLIKHGSNAYDYSSDIDKANEIFKTIKEKEKYEI